MLTTAQRWGIGADLALIREVGFRHVRILTTTKAGDPAYNTWPPQMFLTFPSPTGAELACLAEFFQMVADAGMTYEIVLLMPDSRAMYYQDGVTSADYRAFVDAIFSVMFTGPLNRLYLGGDMRLGDHDPAPAIVARHRRWMLDLWPYLVSRCPECWFGINLDTQNATFWDRAADSLAWIRSNLNPLPRYVGCQLYPTTHVALQNLGFEHGGVVDWSELTQDWINGLRVAAGPSIEVFADEVGLAVGSEFTEADQAMFLHDAVTTLSANWVKACVWEFADHPALGNLGLFTTNRMPRAAVPLLSAPLAAASEQGLLPGVEYTPPEYADLAWLMPS